MHKFVTSSVNGVWNSIDSSWFKDNQESNWYIRTPLSRELEAFKCTGNVLQTVHIDTLIDASDRSFEDSSELKILVLKLGEDITIRLPFLSPFKNEDLKYLRLPIKDLSGTNTFATPDQLIVVLLQALHSSHIIDFPITSCVNCSTKFVTGDFILFFDEKDNELNSTYCEPCAKILTQSRDPVGFSIYFSECDFDKSVSDISTSTINKINKNIDKIIEAERLFNIDLC